MISAGAFLNRIGVKETVFFKRFRAFYRRQQALRDLKRKTSQLAPTARHRVLVINHFFHGELKAINAIQEDFPEVDILEISPEPYFSEIMHLFPQEARTAKIEYDAESLITIREQAKKISRQVFSDVHSRFPFDCVMSPSDSFYWLREFILVCQENKIPFVVADKEGTISPASYETDPPKIRKYYPPLADHFLVWSERQRTYWNKAGVPNSRITITGAARSDIFVNMRRSTLRNVIFSDFDLDAYLNMIDWAQVPWSREKSWKYLRDAFRRAAKKIACEFPDIEVIIKCHPQQVSYDFSDSGLDKLPNVRIVRGAEISELISESYAVAGFQTTALMEAALAKVPVFYAAWGELFEIVKEKMLPFHEPNYGMVLCQSESDLAAQVSTAIKGGYSSALPDSSDLQIFFSHHDGNCARRLLSELVRISRRKP